MESRRCVVRRVESLFHAEEMCSACGASLYSCDTCGWYGCLSEDTDHARAHSEAAENSEE